MKTWKTRTAALASGCDRRRVERTQIQRGDQVAAASSLATTLPFAPNRAPAKGGVNGPAKFPLFVSMAIENVALLAIENVTLRGLTCGGSGATGAGEPAKSLVTLMRPALGKQDVQYVFGLRSDGSPLRARRGGASGSCCPGC